MLVQMGPSPILPVSHTITIGIVLKFNSGNNEHKLKNVTCKQTWTINSFLRDVRIILMAHSDRTYVGPGLGPEWVTVYYVKPSHCNLCENLNGSYTLALYQSQSRSQSHSHISSVWISHNVYVTLCSWMRQSRDYLDRYRN